MKLTFATTLGLQDAPVLVVAEINDHELDEILEVIYLGTNILPTLGLAQHQEIRRNHERINLCAA